MSIRCKDIDLSDELQKLTQEKIGSIEKFFSKVHETRIELAKISQHHKHGEVFEASAEVDVPNTVLYAEASGESIEVAINKLKQNLQRELKQYKGLYKAKQRKAFQEVRQLKAAEL